jgi:tRNA synthetases class II (A)
MFQHVTNRVTSLSQLYRSCWMRKVLFRPSLPNLSTRRLTSKVMYNQPYSGPWTAVKVREEFFNYFRSKNHIFVPSSSTIPYDDPSLLFANAGMNQVCYSHSISVDSRFFPSVQIHLPWNRRSAFRHGKT